MSFRPWKYLGKGFCPDHLGKIGYYYEDMRDQSVIVDHPEGNDNHHYHAMF